MNLNISSGSCLCVIGLGVSGCGVITSCGDSRGESSRALGDSSSGGETRGTGECRDDLRSTKFQESMRVVRWLLSWWVCFGLLLVVRGLTFRPDPMTHHTRRNKTCGVIICSNYFAEISRPALNHLIGSVNRSTTYSFSSPNPVYRRTYSMSSESDTAVSRM